MYEAHWGLTGRPFQLTPDPHFWFETATHRKAMAYLGYGLAQGEGFVVVTGDIGAGKTTLIGHLLETIDADDLHVVRLVSSAIEPADLLRTVATQLDVDPAGLEKAQLLTAIERGLHAVARAGRRTLVVVDEAQALPLPSLEELRMLSNFQAGGHALTQIVLVGQPEFRDRVHGERALEQLRQRVIAVHHLDPMGADEVGDYIAHRLSLVGWRGRPDFAADAFPALHAATGGVPRRINLLAGRVLLHAAVAGEELIDGAVVRAVQADLAADLPGASQPTPDIPALSRDDAFSSTPEDSGPPDRLRDDEEEEASPSISAQSPSPSGEGLGWGLAANGARDTEAPPSAPCLKGRGDDPVDSRLTELEARLEQQDVALRRVLQLLVDWVEADPPVAAPRQHAA